MKSYNQEHGIAMAIRQIKYFNNDEGLTAAEQFYALAS
jgi:hypothetical protein